MTLRTNAYTFPGFNFERDVMENLRSILVASKAACASLSFERPRARLTRE